MRLLLRPQKTKQYRIRLQLMALAVALYSFYPLANAPVARAVGIPGAVVINEFSSYGSADWVELYNTTGVPTVLTGWTIKNAAGQEVVLSGVVPGNSFFVVELGSLLNDAGDTIYLNDETSAPIEDASYGVVGVAAPGVGQSTARATDGGVAWVVDSPTKGTTNAPVDVTPPGTPTGGSPDGMWRPANFMFSWQSVEGANGYEFRIAKEAEPTDLSWKSEILGTPSFSFADVPGHSGGTWYWQVRALDQVKNPSAWSAVWSVNVDETPPSVNVSQPSSGNMYGGPSSQQVAIMAAIQEDHLSSVQVLLDGNVIQENAEPSVNIVMEASSLTDGQHSVLVRAVDVAGNMVEVSRVFVVDTQAPVLSTSVVANQVFKGVVEIDLDGTDAHPKNYAITVLTKNGVIVAPTENDRSGEDDTADPEARAQHTLTYNWDTTAVTDGTYIVRFSGDDEAGNRTIIERTVIVDNVIEPSFGLGGEMPSNDPLLEELSAALTQPFATPQAVLFPLQRPATSVLQNVDEQVVDKNTEEDAAGSGVKDIAVAATQGGWRVLGILWYWWLLLLALAALIIYRTWQVVQSYRMSGKVETS